MKIKDHKQKNIKKAGLNQINTETYKIKNSHIH